MHPSVSDLQAVAATVATWLNNTPSQLAAVRHLIKRAPDPNRNRDILAFLAMVIADINRHGGPDNKIAVDDCLWCYLEPLILKEDNMKNIPDFTANLKASFDELARVLQDKASSLPQDMRDVANTALDNVIEMANKAKDELNKKPPLPLVVYHRNCADGSASAWAMSTWFGMTGAEYIAINPDEGHLIAGRSSEELKDRDIYFVDVCADPALLLVIAQNCKTLTVIDHHATSLDKLNHAPVMQLPNVAISEHCSLNHSGACLTWDYVWRVLRGKEPPNNMLINYVEDRDLWKFNLPMSKEVNAYIAMRGFELNAYSQLNDAFENNLDKVKELGRTLYLFQQQIAENHAKDMVLLEDPKGRRFAFGCASCQISETGEAALRKFPDAQYSLTYFDRNESASKVKRVFSLRSRPGSDMDVGELAKNRGGGGHKNAAGYSVEL